MTWVEDKQGALKDEGKHSSLCRAGGVSNMDDETFISKINRISKEKRLQLPIIEGEGIPSGEAVSKWARFLEACVKSGISLGDHRWRRVAIRTSIPFTTFYLEGGCEDPPDTEFRVGLQLLLGLLHSDKNNELGKEDPL